ncbi:MAG: hypothetical protein IKI00_02885 [Bacteroidales bacterium]|nr:hypothetical protein [Bacteroidales bacterium]
MDTTTDFKVSTTTGYLLNALRHVEAAKDFLYKYNSELLGEDTAAKLSEEYAAVFDSARGYVEKMLAEELRVWANTIDPNTPL